MSKHRFNKKIKVNLNLNVKYIIFIVISVISIVLFVFMYNMNKTGDKKIGVEEKANINYKVYLNDNEFYEKEYIEENKQYVGSLIKNIIANYNYKLDLNSTKEIQYKYKIDATINVSDAGTKKSLYSYTENLLPENSLTSEDGKLSIKEEMVVDYQYFNDIAKSFAKTYSLPSTNTSELKIVLTVKTQYMKESLVTLLVPLTKNTFDIGTSNQLASKQETVNFDVVEDNNIMKKISIFGLISSICVLAYFTYRLIRVILASRTEEQKYKSNVKKILASYGGYINKTDEFKFNLEDFEIIRVGTFLDLLKIKEDLSRPILMIENEEKTNAIFAITDNLRFIYMYELNMNQKRLAEKNEQYDDKIKIGVD